MQLCRSCALSSQQVVIERPKISQSQNFQASKIFKSRINCQKAYMVHVKLLEYQIDNM